MDPTKAEYVLKHLERHNELLLNAHNDMAQEPHKLQVSGEKEAVFSQLHHHYDVWGSWYTNFIQHHIIRRRFVVQGVRYCINQLEITDYLAIGAIFAATDSVCTLHVLHQDETPLLYGLVFGEGVVSDATSVVPFNAIQNYDLSQIDHKIALSISGNFIYLFITSTLLGAVTGLLSAFVIKKLYFGRNGGIYKGRCEAYCGADSGRAEFALLSVGYKNVVGMSRRKMLNAN